MLVFYPSDFSPTCTDQLSIYEESGEAFRAENVQLLGVSVDSAFCHRAFREKLNLATPLLSDFHPKGAVAASYGVYAEKAGVARRALVLVDETGTVGWSYLADWGEIPPAARLLEGVAALSTPITESR